MESVQFDSSPRSHQEIFLPTKSYFSYTKLTRWTIFIFIAIVCGVNTFVALSNGEHNVEKNFGRHIASIVDTFDFFILPRLKKNKQQPEPEVVESRELPKQNDQLPEPDKDTIENSMAESPYDQSIQNRLEHQKQENNLVAYRKPTHSTGWCYIGAGDNGNVCAYVGPNDTCASNDIHETQQQCEHR